MSTLLAFQVARPAPLAAESEHPQGYDAALQSLVWEGDGTVTMAAAVCTRSTAGYHSCSGGGTACRFSGASDCYLAYWALCYRCDY